MALAKIKKKDRVIVLTGKDKGKIGEVLKVMPTESRVLVAGVNMMTRHTRQTQKDAGGIKKMEAPIHVSNVALVDPKDNKATRVGVKVAKDGTKVRVAKRSGEQI